MFLFSKFFDQRRCRSEGRKTNLRLERVQFGQSSFDTHTTPKVLPHHRTDIPLARGKVVPVVMYDSGTAPLMPYTTTVRRHLPG